MTRIVHATWLLSEGGGGIPAVIFPLASEQRARGLDVRVVGVTDPAGRKIHNGQVPSVTVDSMGPVGLGFAPSMRRVIEGERPAVIHAHGLFTWVSRSCHEYSEMHGTARVVSPHGMLDKWALAQSRIKKLAFSMLVESASVRSAQCLHALTDQELVEARNYGYRGPVAIIPNGVKAPGGALDRNGSCVVNGHEFSRSRPFIVFLGRLHPKKGLAALLEAWKRAIGPGRLREEGWSLVVAGPDHASYRLELEAMVRSLAISRDVLFTGNVSGDGKFDLLSAARAFVLPSLSEGLPMAMLEALSVGCPVLLSRQCNLDAEGLGVGLLSEPTTDSLVRMLLRFMGMSERERAEMSTRGTNLVLSRYSWTRVASEFGALYEWLVGGGPKPSSVEVR